MPLLAQVLSPRYSQAADEQYLAGCAYYIKGDYSKAVESLTLAISRNNSDEQLYIKRGASLLNLNQTDQAISDFTEANQINPGVADIWLARAYARTNDPVKALQFLKSHLNSPFRLAEDSIRKDPAFEKLRETPGWFTLWQQDFYTAGEKVMADAEYYVKKKQYDQAVDFA